MSTRRALAALILSIVVCTFVGTAAAQSETPAYEPGAVLIRFKPSTMPRREQVRLRDARFGVSRVDSLVGTLEGASIEKLLPTYDRYLTDDGRRLERTFLLRYTSDVDPTVLVSILERLPEVESARVNDRVAIVPSGTQRYEPADSVFVAGNQWNLNSSNDSLDIDAPEAWAIETGDEDVVISIHDYGTLFNYWGLHPDFNYHYNSVEDEYPYGELSWDDLDGEDDTPGPGSDPDTLADNVIGYNFYMESLNRGSVDSLRFFHSMPHNWSLYHKDLNTIRSYAWHGLAVSSIAAAKAGGTGSMIGVAPYCSVYHVRLSDYTSGTIKGIILAAQQGRVINMSWGMWVYDGDVEAAINTASGPVQSGGYDCVLVAASGTLSIYGSHPHEVWRPARFDSVLGVGSMGTDLDLYDSAYGPEVGWVSLVAPVDTGIAAHVMDDCNYPEVPCESIATSHVGTLGGTSAAAPQVAGVAALVRSRFPNLNQFEVKQRILRSAEFYWDDTMENRKKFGHGKLNAYRALTEWGEISGNVTWDPEDTDDGAYYVSGDLTIPKGASLTINPGTVVRIAPDNENGGVDTTLVEIVVEGELNIGSTGSPVVFESFTDTTSTNRDWWGIFIADSATAVIQNAVVRNAYYGIQTRSSATIKNTLIENCARLGLSIAGDSTAVDSVYAEDVTIRNIPGYDGLDGIGVSLLGKGAVLRLKDCVVENSDYGILAYTDAKLYMEGDSVRADSLWAIGVYNGADATMSGVTVEDNEYIGLRIYNGASVSATGCTFASNDWAGAYVDLFGSVHPNATFSQCTFDGNPDGLRVSSTSNVTLEHSEVVDQTTDGVYCLGGADISVDSTLFDGNDVGLRCDASAPGITGNTFQYNDTGIWASSAANPLVQSNLVTDNDVGLWFTGESTADMESCYSGGSCSDPCTGANSIKNSTTYHVGALNAFTYVGARCNWYGKASPRSDKFYGLVTYQPCLGEDPFSGVAGYPGEKTSPLPKVYALWQNYPNPFNPTTTIRYAVPSPGGRVSIQIYNVQGQLVRTLVDEAKDPGYHTALWQGENNRGQTVASGVYFVQMLAPEFRTTKKLLILK